jgi:peptide/nickel transport system ATP-binding protein
MLERVGIPLPEQRLDEYSYQLSGGMQQRAMIAMALSCRPDILIADEPTTALDVTIQAQILELIKELQRELGMAVLLITHNLGVIAETADRVAVMYAGKIVESAPVEALFGEPKHPYTQALFESLPSRRHRGGQLHTIPGVVPPATEFPEGCRFCARCEQAMPRCRQAEPPLAALTPHHHVACFLYP